METEKARLERRISALAVAMEAMTEEGEDTTSAEVTLATLKDRLAILSRPAIKDGVLFRLKGKINPAWVSPIYTTSTPEYIGFIEQRDDMDKIPLTIEDLLPTLAQWVPGAVRWMYGCSDRILIQDENGRWNGGIPAPPRDDWENVGGEL